MRLSMEEPTGMRVRDGEGREVTLTFAAFAAAVERGVILPDDHVRSHIVTADRWVRVGDLRMYGVLREGVNTRFAPTEPGSAGTHGRARTLCPPSSPASIRPTDSKRD